MIDYERFCIEKCGNKNVYFLFDYSSKHIVSAHTWSIDEAGYACSNINGKVKRLHRMVVENVIKAELPRELYVDHINQDKMDNRLCNLRIVTPQISARNMPIRANNTSGSTGVSKGRDGKGFRAYITANKRRIELGTYKTFDEALSARQEAEKHYGFTGKQNLNDLLSTLDSLESNNLDYKPFISEINDKIKQINEQIFKLNEHKECDNK